MKLMDLQKSENFTDFTTRFKYLTAIDKYERVTTIPITQSKFHTNVTPTGKSDYKI